MKITTDTEEKITKIINRYIAKTLSEQEQSPYSEHKQIFKRQMRFLQEDIISLCGENNGINRRD